MIRIIFLIIIFSFTSVAMLEFEGKVRELLEKKGYKAKISIEKGIDELINVFSYSKEKIINNY